MRGVDFTKDRNGTINLDGPGFDVIAINTGRVHIGIHDVESMEWEGFLRPLSDGYYARSMKVWSQRGGVSTMSLFSSDPIQLLFRGESLGEEDENGRLVVLGV